MNGSWIAIEMQQIAVLSRSFWQAEWIGEGEVEISTATRFGVISTSPLEQASILLRFFTGEITASGVV